MSGNVDPLGNPPTPPPVGGGGAPLAPQGAGPSGDTMGGVSGVGEGSQPFEMSSYTSAIGLAHPGNHDIVDLVVVPGEATRLFQQRIRLDAITDIHNIEEMEEQLLLELIDTLFIAAQRELIEKRGRISFITQRRQDILWMVGDEDPTDAQERMIRREAGALHDEYIALVAELDDLNTEKANPNTTPERIIEIDARIAEILLRQGQISWREQEIRWMLDEEDPSDSMEDHLRDERDDLGTEIGRLEDDIDDILDEYEDLLALYEQLEKQSKNIEKQSRDPLSTTQKKTKGIQIDETTRDVDFARESETPSDTSQGQTIGGSIGHVINTTGGDTHTASAAASREIFRPLDTKEYSIRQTNVDRLVEKIQANRRREKRREKIFKTLLVLTIVFTILTLGVGLLAFAPLTALILANEGIKDIRSRNREKAFQQLLVALKELRQFNEIKEKQQDLSTTDLDDDKKTKEKDKEEDTEKVDEVDQNTQDKEVRDDDAGVGFSAAGIILGTAEDNITDIVNAFERGYIGQLLLGEGLVGLAIALNRVAVLLGPEAAGEDPALASLRARVSIAQKRIEEAAASLLEDQSQVDRVLGSLSSSEGYTTMPPPVLLFSGMPAVPPAAQSYLIPSPFVLASDQSDIVQDYLTSPEGANLFIDELIKAILNTKDEPSIGLESLARLKEAGIDITEATSDEMRGAVSGALATAVISDTQSDIADLRARFDRGEIDQEAFARGLKVTTVRMVVVSALLDKAEDQGTGGIGFTKEREDVEVVLRDIRQEVEQKVDDESLKKEVISFTDFQIDNVDMGAYLDKFISPHYQFIANYSAFNQQQEDRSIEFFGV